MGLILRNNAIIKNLVIGGTGGGGESGGGGGGGSISTTNLLFHYDIGNSSSYSGTGTSISDLSGNSYTGTLDTNGSYVSDGSASYVHGRKIETPVLGTSLGEGGTGYSFTMSGWYRFSVLPTGGSDVFMFRTGVNTSAVEIRYIKSDETFYGLAGPAFSPRIQYSSGANLDEGKVDVSSSISANTWFNLAVTAAAGGSWILYLNGSAILTQSITNSNAINFNTNEKVRVATNKNHTTGDVHFGQFAMYSEELSSSDITSNYNALKSRYGL